MKRELAVGKIIEIDGDTWEVIGSGVERENQTYCHLASKTRFTKTKNGNYPAQSCQFVDDQILISALFATK